MNKNVKITLEVILIILALVIIFQNADPVQLKVFFWEFNASLIILLLLVLLLGMAIGYFLPKLTKKKENKD